MYLSFRKEKVVSRHIALSFGLLLNSKHRIIVWFPRLPCSWSETSPSPQAGQFVIDPHHCHTCTGVRFADDFTPVRIVDRFRLAGRKIIVQHIDNIKHNNIAFIRECVLGTNSLIAASHTKWFHADTLVTVWGHPGFSYPIHLSHVFTAPWTCRIFLMNVIPALKTNLNEQMLKIQTIRRCYF